MLTAGQLMKTIQYMRYSLDKCWPLHQHSLNAFETEISLQLFLGVWMYHFTLMFRVYCYHWLTAV